MFVYRVVVLTVPPNFQYQNEKQWAANQRFCSMKIWMYKRSSLVEQHFLFSTEIWAEQLKKHPVYSRALGLARAIISPIAVCLRLGGGRHRQRSNASLQLISILSLMVNGRHASFRPPSLYGSIGSWYSQSTRPS